MTTDVFTTPEERASDQEWTEDYLNVEKYLHGLQSRAAAAVTAATDAGNAQLANFWNNRNIRIVAAIEELNFGNA